VNIVEVTFPLKDHSYRDEIKDPFDIWFDQNINTFDQEPDEKLSDYEQERREWRRSGTSPRSATWSRRTTKSTP
jgi:hypothetical protein